MAARHEEGCYEKKSSNISLFAKSYRTMTSGWQGASYFMRYGLELVSKPAISLKKSWGGYRRTTLEEARGRRARHDESLCEGNAWLFFFPRDNDRVHGGPHDRTKQMNNNIKTRKKNDQKGTHGPRNVNARARTVAQLRRNLRRRRKDS